MDSPSDKPTAANWAGRLLSLALALFLLVSGALKLQPQVFNYQQLLDELEIPHSMFVALAVIEIVSALLFVIPQTAVVGAILLTGYMGGAICTHWRVGDLFIIQALIPILVWLAVALREPRLWALIPWRRL